MTARPIATGREPALWGLCCLVVVGLHGLIYAWLPAPVPTVVPDGLPMLVDFAPDAVPDPAPQPMPDPAPVPDPEPEPAPDDPAPSAPDMAPLLPVPPAPPAHLPVRRPPTVQRQVARPVPSAAPPMESPPTRPAPAAVAASTPSDPGAVPNWRGRLMRRLHDTLRYPPDARGNEEQGVASITFTMTRDGHVLSVLLARSSGHPSLDAEALAMLRRADPLPQPPPELAGTTLTLSVPVQFSLRDTQ